MDISDAERLLLFDTQHEPGTYTRLRLGENPGSEAIDMLRRALELIGDKYAVDSVIPREIAYSCGVILHFATECQWSLKKSGLSELIDAVTVLKQGAFNVLAGNL